MNEQVLITLCEKLGTTIDNLIPRVIEFGLLDSKQGLLVGINHEQSIKPIYNFKAGE